ncbi:hypothetical protein SLE2022_314970 [Rubroshorea leprosula]
MATQPSASRPSAFWKSIWKLRVPPKVQLFIWRTCHNALSSQVNLYRRGVVESPLCSSCQAKDENIPHLLFSCPHAKASWFISNLGFIPDESSLSDFGDWWALLCSNFKNDERLILERVATLCWQIWCARNKRIFEQSQESPTQTVYKASVLLQEFLSAKEHDRLQIPSLAGLRLSSDIKWQKPSVGWYKFNCDTAFDPHSHRAATAVVCRNELGQLISGCSFVRLVLSPAVGEACALLFAICFAQSLNISHAVFESDCKLVVDSVHGKLSKIPWEISSTISEIKDKLSSSPWLSLQHISRPANLVADWVAKATLKGTCPHYWAYCPPHQLLVSLHKDVYSS